jgi:hypothetical protein
MTLFEDWWAKLSPAEQKMIGVNNAKFVWEEARRQAPSTLYLNGFQVCRIEDDLIIMSTNGEGGRFNMQEFEDVVRDFFNKNF